MTLSSATRQAPPQPNYTRVALILLALACGLGLLKSALPSGFVRPPEWLILPFADWINGFF